MIYLPDPFSTVFYVVLTILIVHFIKLRGRRTKVDPQGKYVLITGCDSGFGREISLRLDKLGFHVFATCLGKDGEEYLKKNCSDRVQTLILDIREENEISRVFEEVKKAIPGDTGNVTY